MFRRSRKRLPAAKRELGDRGRVVVRLLGHRAAGARDGRGRGTRRMSSATPPSWRMPSRSIWAHERLRRGRRPHSRRPAGVAAGSPRRPDSRGSAARTKALGPAPTLCRLLGGIDSSLDSAAKTRALLGTAYACSSRWLESPRPHWAGRFRRIGRSLSERCSWRRPCWSCPRQTLIANGAGRRATGRNLFSTVECSAAAGFLPRPGEVLITPQSRKARRSICSFGIQSYCLSLKTPTTKCRR